MSNVRQKAKVALALGLINLARVVVYRIGVRIGLNPVRRLRAKVPVAPFFKAVTPDKQTDLHVPSNWFHEARYFGWYSVPVFDQPPDWYCNPLTGACVKDPARPWWAILDFDDEVGDIKGVWEASRFDWVLAFAQRARCGNVAELDRLNIWLSDWSAKNPPYSGPNWKCGQEASIRVMHLSMAALILGQTAQPASGLVDLVRLHLQRIAPTVSYSMAQDNNHGTSEAAALFIGGNWLSNLSYNEGLGWHKTGRKWLENRVSRLISSDGSFSQYSLNYHRMVLDTLSLVEVWRRHFGLPQFSKLFQSRAAASARWLASMVDPVSGDAPNLGANDGARLLPLTDSDYRDFRPSVQLGMVLFTSEKAYDGDGGWNQQLAWLGIALPEKVANAPVSQMFDDGGYAVLRRGDAMALLRYPRFRFRPSHADALHIDIFVSGENLLRDSGSYSYNNDPEWLAYFPGTSSHNTVQFDGRDQMPRLSRFLFGDWLKTEALQTLVAAENETTFSAVYSDRQGAMHKRSLQFMAGTLVVRDEIAGFKRNAVLRWRLMPGEWNLSGNRLSDGKYSLTVHSTVPIIRIELVTGWESRYYVKKTPIPVLEVEIHEPGILTTEHHWSV